MNEKTKEQIVKDLNLRDIGQFDYALPHDWVKDLAAKLEYKGLTYGDIGSSFVWFYPRESKCGLNSYPWPLNQTGVEILQFINVY